MNDPEDFKAGAKIIKGLDEAIVGKFSRVTIGDQVWIRETPLHRAAPELVEALKDYVIFFGTKAPPRLEAEARAAIAKAEDR